MSSRSRLRGALVAIHLVLACTSGLTSLPRAACAAESESEQAHVAFEKARDAFARRSYAAAAELFEESASHVLHPAPLVNAADAWERAGDYVRVARVCDRLLAMPEIGPEIRTQTETRLARVLSHVATLELEGPVGTSVRIDGGPAVDLPLRVRIQPGPHGVEVSGGEAQAPRSVRVVADPGVTTRRTLGERELAGAQAKTGPLSKGEVGSREPAGIRPPPTLSWVSFGVAALALGGGAYFGASTLDARSRWVETADLDARSDFYRDRALTNAAFGVAIVGAAVGTVLWLTAR